MIYIKFWLLVIVNLFCNFVINFPTVPFVVLFASDDGWLPKWLSWYQTPDNSLDGDSGWKNGTRPIKVEKTKLDRYRNRIHWLWRNKLYGFGRDVLGVKCNFGTEFIRIIGNDSVGNGPSGVSGLVRRYYYRDNKLRAFQWYYIRQYKHWPTKCIRINVGWKIWNIEAVRAGRLHFVFSPSPFMHFLI